MSASESEILVGGQAVLEGVMMKLPRTWAVTVRRADGSLVTRADDFVPWSDRWPILRWPFVRGAAVLGQMMALGMRALVFSSDVAAQESGTEAPSPKKTTSIATCFTLATLMVTSAVADGPDGDEVDGNDTLVGRKRSDAAPAGGVAKTSSGLSKGELALTLVMALAMFFLVFKAIPLGIALLAAKVWPALGTHFFESLISGIALAAVFIGYLLLISRMRDIQRVFRYHGAEHKVVHAHEARQSMTVANAREHSTIHPRCGTSFLFFVVLTSIVVWSLFPVATSFAGKFALRLALFPLVLGLAFELIRLSSRHRTNWFFRALMAPGLWSQRITTKPPDDSMLEVSLHSLSLATERASAGAASPASRPA